MSSSTSRLWAGSLSARCSIRLPRDNEFGSLWFSRESWLYWTFHGPNWIAVYQAIGKCMDWYIRVPRWRLRGGHRYWHEHQGEWFPFFEACSAMSVDCAIWYTRKMGLQMFCGVPSERIPGKLLRRQFTVDPEAILREFQDLAERVRVRE